MFLKIKQNILMGCVHYFTIQNKSKPSLYLIHVRKCILKKWSLYLVAKFYPFCHGVFVWNFEKEKNNLVEIKSNVLEKSFEARILMGILAVGGKGCWLGAGLASSVEHLPTAAQISINTATPFSLTVYRII